MSKFNLANVRSAVVSPINSISRTRTHEGGEGHVRDAKSELFILAVSNMVGEQTFYEGANDRDGRFRTLIAQIAVEDGPWLARFLPWLRTEANLRSASLVGALEAVRARLVADPQDGVANRELVASVLQRADEPGEALAYWTSVYGRAIPKPVKRGVADAVQRLYTERSLLKYDSGAKGFRFGDVIELVHPSPAPDKADRQGALFAYALDRRHDRPNPIAEELALIRSRAELMALPVEQRRAVVDPRQLAKAGMTWEALAGWLQGPLDAAAWESVIPSMGYMALLRNLRNFDEAGVSDKVAERVAAKLADPAEVACSRQLPFRFVSAYEAAPSLRWGHALDMAVGLSLANIPALPGRSLVLVDTSASMTSGSSARSVVTPAKAAALFGVALAAKGERVDLVGFADGVFRHELPKGASVLRGVEGFLRRIGEVGHGTRIAESLRASFVGHDRVFLISDMQTMDSGTGSAIPATTPLYAFNLGGYRPAAMRTGGANRHEFGGLTDTTFRMIPQLEAARNGDWPF